MSLRFVSNLERKEASDYLIDREIKQEEVHEARELCVKKFKVFW